MSDKIIVLDQPDQIKCYQYLAQLSACKLELIGLKHSRGSVINAVKYQHQFLGNKRRVVEQFRDWLVKQKFLDPASPLAQLPDPKKKL